MVARWILSPVRLPVPPLSPILLKNAHLRRQEKKFELQRTTQYASAQIFSPSLHLDIFEQNRNARTLLSTILPPFKRGVRGDLNIEMPHFITVSLLIYLKSAGIVKYNASHAGHKHYNHPADNALCHYPVLHRNNTHRHCVCPCGAGTYIFQIAVA